MYRVAKVKASEREILFRRTAIKNGLSVAIVEKDFWVCLILDYLFNKSKYKDYFAFKGGTSLSKGYGLIERFSEDVDLILDWRLLGYGINEPWKSRSNTQQLKFCDEANQKAELFIANELIIEMQRFLSEEIGIEPDLAINERDKQTLEYAYPQSFVDDSILGKIRLEIGPLAAWTPAKNVVITSYVADFLPSAFIQPATSVRTTAAERTFWEKVTILHKVANKTNGLFPDRYSRHYYDLYCMSFKEVKDLAYNDRGLLEKVVSFKEKFYRCPSAHYEEIHHGKIRIVPKEQYLDIIEKDYISMQGMIFGEKPTFCQIMDRMQYIEKEMNK